MPDSRRSGLTGAASFNSAAPALHSMSVVHGAAVSSSSFFTATTDSSSSTTGALPISGGLGVAKTVHIGDTLSVASSAAATSASSASVTIAGGVGVSDNIITGVSVEVQSSAGSYNSSTDALKVSGGLGVDSSGYFSGNLFVGNDTQATSLTLVPLATRGGV